MTEHESTIAVGPGESGAPSANGPSGRVAPSSGPEPFNRTSSRLEPPRSPTTPSASGCPAITPSAAKRARTVGACKAVRVSRCSFSTISGGVLAGR